MAMDRRADAGPGGEPERGEFHPGPELGVEATLAAYRERAVATDAAVRGFSITHADEVGRRQGSALGPAPSHQRDRPPRRPRRRHPRICSTVLPDSDDAPSKSGRVSRLLGRAAHDRGHRTRPSGRRARSSSAWRRRRSAAATCTSSRASGPGPRPCPSWRDTSPPASSRRSGAPSSECVPGRPCRALAAAIVRGLPGVPRGTPLDLHGIVRPGRTGPNRSPPAAR